MNCAGVYVCADLTTFKGQWENDTLAGVSHPQTGALRFGASANLMRYGTEEMQLPFVARAFSSETALIGLQ